MSDVEPRRVSSRIFLRTDRSKETFSLRRLLMSPFRLACFGTDRLSPSALLALRRGKLLLLVVMIFDLIMWSTLLNLIFMKGEMGWGRYTPLALLVAALLSITTVTFESSLFTSDLSIRRLRDLVKLVSVAVRIGLVIGSAYMTAQPLHVLLFDGPIRERLLEEKAIALAVGYVGEMERIDSELTAQTRADFRTDFSRGIEKRQETIDQLTRDKVAKEGLKTGRENRLRTIDREIARVGGWLDTYDRRLNLATTDEERLAIEQERTRKQAYYNALKRERPGVESEIATLGAETNAIENRITPVSTELKTKLGDEETWLTERRKKNEAERQSRADFIREIRDNGDPDKKVSWSKGGFATTFELEPCNFFECLRILEDLRHGRPARWPDTARNLSASEKTTLRKYFKLSQDVPAPAGFEEWLVQEAEEQAAPPAKDKAAYDAWKTAALEQYEVWRKDEASKLQKAWDDEAKQRLEASEGFDLMWWAVLVVGMVIPLLALFMKFTLPRELKRYYSLDWQAASGAPEALAVVMAEERLSYSQQERRRATLWYRLLSQLFSGRRRTPRPVSSGFGAGGALGGDMSAPFDLDDETEDPHARARREHAGSSTTDDDPAAGARAAGESSTEWK